MVLDPVGYKTTVWSGLGMILIGLTIAFLGYWGSAEERQIRDHGVETMATIVNKGSDNDRDNARHFFNLSFTDKTRHVATRNVDQALWDSMRVGERVAIKYLPKHPTRLRLVSEMRDPNEMFYWLGAIGGGLSLTGLGFMFLARIRRPGPASSERRSVEHVN